MTGCRVVFDLSRRNFFIGLHGTGAILAAGEVINHETVFLPLL
jgi:hypothetical protein